MAIMAKWRTKTWEVSAKKVNALAALSFSYTMKAQVNTDLEENPKTNERGTELFPLSFETQLHSGAGIDVRAEIESWEALVTKAGDFYLQGRRLGPPLQLKQVTVGDVILDDFGRIRAAKLSFSFIEYDPATTPVLDPTSALHIGPAADDKKEMAPANSQLAAAETTGLKVGCKVKPTGEKYYTGEKIPQWVKDRAHIVSQIRGEKTLLGHPDGINSWVYTAELTLV